MQKIKVKFGDPKIEERIIQAIREEKIPVDVGWVANRLGVGWGTASRILLNMALKGKLSALKTTKSFVFTLPKEGA
jgi:hypothetical protein